MFAARYSCQLAGFRSVAHIRGESEKDGCKCSVTGAHHQGEKGVRVGIAVFGDNIPDPKNAKLQWDTGSGHVLNTKFSINDPSWCVTGNLFFEGVPTEKPLSFKFGDGFKTIDFQLPSDEGLDINPDPNKKEDVFQSPPQTKTMADPTANPLTDVNAAGSVKKALLVGINYEGQDCALEGCINDVKGQKEILMGKFGFKDADIKMLTEDQSSEEAKPNKKNMLAGMKWLVEGTKSGDTIFFQYSGHGTQTPSDEEADGENEAIVPVDVFDAEWPQNLIMDDDLHKNLCELVPDGVKCICIYDCCHSATMEDLAVTKTADGQVVTSSGDNPGAKSRSLKPPKHIKAGLKPKKASRSRDIPKMGPSTKNIWVFSGCQDNQTSSDAFIGGKHQGALSWAMSESLKDAVYNITFNDLLKATSQKLQEGGYSQEPALSSTSSKLTSLHYMTCE